MFDIQMGTSFERPSMGPIKKHMKTTCLMKGPGLDVLGNSLYLCNFGGVRLKQMVGGLLFSLAPKSRRQLRPGDPHLLACFSLLVSYGYKGG